MASGSGGGRQIGWAAMRPVFVAFLLLMDGFTVGALAFSQKPGWVVPFIAFGVILVGLVWFEGWAVMHRRDDE
jgi:hypothetical protein